MHIYGCVVVNIHMSNFLVSAKSDNELWTFGWRGLFAQALGVMIV